MVLDTGSAGTSKIRRVATGGHDLEFSTDCRLNLIKCGYQAIHFKRVTKRMYVLKLETMCFDWHIIFLWLSFATQTTKNIKREMKWKVATPMKFNLMQSLYKSTTTGFAFPQRNLITVREETNRKQFVYESSRSSFLQLDLPQNILNSLEKVPI